MGGCCTVLGSCTNQVSSLTVILGGVSQGSVLNGSPTHLVNGNVWNLDFKERFGFQSLNCHIRITQVLHGTVIE